ncbi:MAG: hypothetical protein Q7R52_01805 [archaeon]|nr:hypothetical protein [archaeon]
MKTKTITLTPEDDVSLKLRILYKDKELLVTKAVLTLDVADYPRNETNKELIEDMKNGNA